MSYTDKTLTCWDCGASFTFGASEQEFFASKGFENEPKRCPECRASRKMQRGGGYSSRGYGYQREMHPVICAACGASTQVPFEPRNGRPVYCSDCFTTMKR